MGPPVQLEEATNGGNYDRESNGNKGSNIECNESKARVKGMDECKEPVRSGSEEPLPPQGRSWNKARGVFVENYPNPLAGAPVSNKKQDPPDLAAYMRDCGPLGDPTVFETAKILMTTVPTDEGKDLHIKSTLYRGRVPWDKVEDLLHHVDQLPHGANWRIIEIEVHVEGKDVPRVAHLCARDVVEIVVELMGNPWFASYMKFAPERHWTAKKDGERIYNKMWTGDWWWNIQQLLNEAFGDATVAALIVLSDKTQVSILPGGQQVYPVYMLLGNICKSLRRKASERSTVLLGYLPVEDFDNIEDDNKRQRLKGQLVHDAMRELMKPLEAASRDGVEMWCADGRLCRVFPIVALYVANWPEQCLMACTMQSRCPMCTIEYDKRGVSEKCPRRKPPDTLDALEEYFDNGDVRHLNQGPGLKPWWLWWANIPYCDIHASMTPDILHQLWLGLFKTHILAWMQWSLGKDELDKRFMTMPEAQGLRSFSSGVSGIGQWTGREAREMAKQMLCAVAGSVDNEEAELARIGIEFMSYAELPTMRESDVAKMERLLTEFHDLKWIMVNEEFGYYKNESSFNAVPKLHMITHYGASVRLYGTLDGFNSKVPKNLHIHYAKKPWRASNKVRPKKQMMVYIQRQEAIRIHRSYMNLYCGIAVKDADAGEGADVELEQREYAKGDLEQEGGVQTIEDPASVLPCRQPRPSQVWYPNPRMTIAKNPTHDKVPCRTVINEYGAKDFIELLTKLLADQFDTPAYKSLLLENHQYAVWHQLYLEHPRPPFAIGWPHTDIIWANPPPCNVAGTCIGLGTYDVVLVLDKPGAGGIHRYRAARVRVIFKLPTTHLRGIYDGHLAYIELFNPFSSAPSPSAPCLYTTLHLLRGNGQRKHAIVRVSNIKLACHLAPQFDRLRDWTPGPNRDIMTVLQYFYLNPHYNHYVFALLENWRRSDVCFKRGV